MFSKQIRVKRKPDSLSGPAAAEAYHKDLIKETNYNEVRLAMPDGLAAHCVMDSAYWIPRAMLSAPLYRDLKKLLTTNPKKKYNPMTDRLESNPWPMYTEMDDAFGVPREFGCEMLGPAGTRDVAALEVHFPQPRLPLLDADTAAKMFKVDQVTAVDTTLGILHDKAETRGFGSAIFSIPTGNGKTACAITMAARLGMRTLMVIPNVKLFAQIKEEWENFLGPDVRVEVMHTSKKCKRTFEKDHNVHVILTTFASAAGIAYDMDGFGTVIVDEAHETITAKTAEMYRCQFKCKFLIMLTATPERGDECGAYLEWLGGKLAHYEKVDLKRTLWGGIDIVVIPIVYNTRDPPKTVKRKAGGDRMVTNAESMTRQIMHCKQRNDFLAGYFGRTVRDADRHILVGCTRIEHVEQMQKMMQSDGIDTGIMIGAHTDGKPPTKEENEHAYRCRVLLAQIRMGHRAVNIPRITDIAFLSGGAWQDDTFWAQFLGRELRWKKDKLKPRVLLFKDILDDSMYFENQVDRAIASIKRLAKDPSSVQVVTELPHSI